MAMIKSGNRYPFLFERLWGAVELSAIWRYGYIALTVLVAACLIAAWRTRPGREIRAAAEFRAEDHTAFVPVSLKNCVFWVFAALVPSALMLGVTNHITTNIATFPLLWVLPLCLYLLTFVIVFARKQIVPHKFVIKVLPFLILPLALTLFVSSMLEFVLIPFHLMLFFVVALACHGELAQSRPAKSRLTEYYFLMALGGAVGGIFVTIVSPMLFKNIIEYPVTLFLALLVLTKFSFDRSQPKRNMWGLLWLIDLLAILILFVAASKFYGINNGTFTQLLYIFVPSAIIVFTFRKNPWRFALAYGTLLVAIGLTTNEGNNQLVYQSRNFYGSKRIVENEGKTGRAMFHGTTLHGAQYLDAPMQIEPVAYYNRKGPLGDIFDVLSKKEKKLSIAVVGLGTGTVASYVGAGSKVTFYEIDSAIKEIADDKQYFTYLRNIQGDYEIAVGDGRLLLNKSSNGTYDMIFLDAFNSDSVPVHLMTREALSIYKAKIKTDGILVFHITNRFIDLKPVLASHAHHFEMAAVTRYDRITGSENQKDRLSSEYAVLSLKTSAVTNTLLDSYGWKSLGSGVTMSPWTDQYSNVVSLFKFKDLNIWQ
jgi:predicted O-methyltransferase YrrM